MNGEDSPCTEKPWSQKESETLMTAGQNDRYAEWSTTMVAREENGHTKKEPKAFQSWRKIYKTLYPDVVNFPDPCRLRSEFSPHGSPSSTSTKAALPSSAGETQTTQLPSSPHDRNPDRGGMLQINQGTDSIERVSDSDILTVSNDADLAFRSPFSGDLSFTQHQQRRLVEDRASWIESTDGPESLAQSASSGFDFPEQRLMPAYVQPESHSRELDDDAWDSFDGTPFWVAPDEYPTFVSLGLDSQIEELAEPP